MFDVTQEFQEKLKDVMRENLITFTPNDDWYAAALASFKYASPISLGMMGKEMKALEEKLQTMGGETLTFYEFAITNSCIEARSRQELPFENYFEVMEECGRCGLLWNLFMETQKKPIMDKIIKNKPLPTNGNRLGQA